MDTIILGASGVVVAASIGTLWRLVLMKADKADLDKKANKEVVDLHTEMFSKSLEKLENGMADLATKSETRQREIWEELRKMNGGRVAG